MRFSTEWLVLLFIGAVTLGVCYQAYLQGNLVLVLVAFALGTPLLAWLLKRIDPHA
jgi:hypothetical protein